MHIRAGSRAPADVDDDVRKKFFLIEDMRAYLNPS
jgi:hypothetical protein